MKKIKTDVLIILMAALLVFLLSCDGNNTNETVDYSQYSFTDISWTRKAEHDIETVRFGSDGSFVYYCACGNPVNDSDLSDGYTYDDEAKTITVKYFETTDETISTIKIEACDGESIKLDFDGEIREFVKDKN